MDSKYLTPDKVIYWLPRWLAIGFIGFLGVFAFDVFGMEGTLLEQIIRFLMHLIPNYVLLIMLIIAWRKERIGGILFLLAGIMFAYLFIREGEWMSFLIISTPLFLIGSLFLLEHIFVRSITVIWLMVTIMTEVIMNRLMYNFR